MRQIVLDTETTGLEVEEGHRLIEIAGVELQNRRRTDNTYHTYLNPERSIDAGALQVHGITEDFLRDKPVFKDQADALLKYLQDADEILIHNARFDIGFLDTELRLAGYTSSLEQHLGGTKIIDTLKLARDQYPRQRNSLDALCKRLNIDNSSRKQHNARLDAEILAQVYLAMTGGQKALFVESSKDKITSTVIKNVPEETSYQIHVRRASHAEIAMHEHFLDKLDQSSNVGSVWRRTGQIAQAGDNVDHAAQAS